MSERIVGIERDQWLLISAHAPDQVRKWVTEKAAMLDDDRFVDAYRAFDQAFEWRPGDPRLEQLADDLLAFFGEPNEHIDQADVSIDDTVVAMFDAQTTEASPGWRHLAALLEQRGRSEHSNPESPPSTPHAPSAS